MATKSKTQLELEKVRQNFGLSGTKTSTSSDKGKQSTSASSAPAKSEIVKTSTNESAKTKSQSALEKVRQDFGLSTKTSTATNPPTKNAYTSVKDKLNTSTTITSSLTDEKRNKRIKEINSELTELSKARNGLSRASHYGNVDDMIAKNEARRAELETELKELERVGTFSASELNQFEIEDAKKKVSGLQQKVQSFGTRPSVDVADEWGAANSELYNARKELETLEREKALYKDITKFDDIANNDDFWGQWKANYRSKDIYEKAAKAFSAYMDNPTDENLELAMAYDAFSKEYAKNNEKALDDEGQVLPLLSKNLADYAAQLKGSAGVAVPLGAFGAALGGLGGGVTGAKIGWTAGYSIGTGYNSYNVIRGALFNELLSYGIDEETAYKLADDDATIESLIESGETVKDWAFMLFGGGANKLAKGTKIASRALNKAAKSSAKYAARPFLNLGLNIGKGIGLNSITEYGEEFAQGATSRATREKALSMLDNEIGQYGEGNIDLHNRPVYQNEDGTISTVDSVTYQVDDKFIVLPTIVRDENGNPKRLNTDEEIFAHYEKTGEYLGAFDTQEEADKYANRLHYAQAYRYSNNTTVDSDDSILAGAVKVLGDSVLGGNTEAFSELHEQGSEGFKTGLVTGGIHGTVKFVTSSYAQAKTVKEQNEIADFVKSDSETLDALIEEGKASGAGTVSAEIAEEVEKAKEQGKVTREQVKKLIASNDVYIQEENKSSSKDTIEQAAIDVVNARNRSGTYLEEQLEEQSKANEPLSVEDVRRATGFDRSGAELVADYSNMDGATFSQVVTEVKPSYMSGVKNPNLDVSKMGNTFKSKAQLEAFKAGQLDSRMQIERENASNVVVNKESGFSSENLPSDVTKTQIEILDQIYKGVGLKGYVTKGLKGNAELNRQAGEAPIDFYFEREVGQFGSDQKQKVSIVFHGAHEAALHRVVQLAPEEGTAFVYAMYDHLTGGNEPSNFTLADQKRNAYASKGVEISLSKAMEEISANNILYLYNNDESKFQKAIDSIVNGKNEKAKQGLRKYIDYLKQIVRKIRAFLKAKTAAEEAEILAELNEIDRLRDMFETAFAKAVENRKAAEAGQSSDTKSSKNLEIKTNQDYNVNVSHSLKAQRGRTIELETMENNRFERLREFHGNLPSEWFAYTDNYFYVYSNQSYMDYTILLQVSLTNRNKHSIDVFMEEIENGVNGSRKILDYWIKNFRRGKGRYTWNPISSSTKKTAGRVDGVDVRPSRSYNVTDIERSGEYSESEVTLKAIDKEYIELAKGPVKNEARLRYSLKDSDGNTLTEEQAEFFKDSKVRDENGNLIVAYHGTRKGGFTVFNRNHNYYTDSRETAESYAPSGVVYAGYLNITKPYIIDAGGEKWSAIPISEEVKKMLDAAGSSTFKERGKWCTSVADIVAAVSDLVEDGEADYDGVIISNVDDTGSYYKDSVKNIGNDYITFSSEQFKNTDNLHPTSDPDINFSLKESVEETKNLIAVHNMQVSELERTLDLGGLPMPSIAIIKAQSGHSEYGDVSLVFDKTVIDPKTSKLNKVYGGDAWTPTYPKIEYKPNEKLAKKIRDKYYDFSRKFGYDESRPLYNYVNDLENQLNRTNGEAGMLEELYKDTRVMQFYLLDSGKGKVETINKETRTELTDAEVEMNEFFIKELGAGVVDAVKWDGNSNPAAYRKNYLSKYEDAIREAYKKLLIQDYQFTEEQVQNVLDSTKPYNYLNFVRDAQKYRENGRVTIKTEADYEATQEAIRASAGEDYREWVDSLFKGIEEKSGIRNNVSYYTNSGNQRSWEALHWENNLENVVRVMNGDTDVGSGFLAAQSIWGVSAKNYGSIEEIKADSDRLKQMPEEEYNKIKESFGERLSEIAHSIMDKGERNPFIAVDNAMECIVEAVRKSKTKSGILNHLKQYKHLTVTTTTADDIAALVSDIANMPTEYFEAKPQRAVGLNEIATAIIPDSTSESTKSRLSDMGIKYLEYEAGNETARLEALNSIEDVQFSLKGTDINYKDTRDLLNIIDHLRGEFEVTKFAKADPKKLSKMTKDLLKEYSSHAEFDETFNAIDGLYQYMANGEDGHPAVWDDVYNRAYKVAQEIVKNAVMVDDSAYQEYKYLRNYLRSTPMKFTQYDSIPASYENFNDFRKHNIGRLKFTKDGNGIDAVYHELSGLYPEFFDEHEETNSAAQLERMLDVLDSLQPAEVNPFDGQVKEASMHLTNDLIDRFFDVPQAKPTFADKAERRVTEAKIKSGKRVEAVRQQKDAKIKKLIESQREKTKKQLDKLRQQRDSKIKKEREKRRASISKMSESQKAKVLRAKILRHTSDLSKKLLNPTDNQHIPFELQGAVAKLLECINLESNYTYDTESHSYKKNDEGLPTKRTEAFHALQKVYADIASSVVVDPDLLGEYGLLSGVMSLSDKRISDMTSSELETVWQALRAIEASISSANKLFSQGKFETILEVAETLREENKGKKEKTEFKGVLGKGKNLTMLDMLTPETYLHYLGNAGDSIFRMMRNAQDKHISIMKEVSDFTHQLLDGVNVNSLEKTVHTVKLGGKDVKLTTAQLMELYVLMKRDQAVDHIMVGGILPDAIEGKGLKKITRTEPIRNISVPEIAEATSKLTDDQKKIAEELQKYVSTVLGAYGNEASMQVYNYEKFNEENYWTIRTNKQEIQSDVDKDTAVTSVANKGMTKATKPHANTSVRIGSIFDTFAAHSSDMATYAAWLGTSEDVNRIRNFVFWEDGARTGTVKGILDTVHGVNGSKYLEKLLTDIAIGVKGTDNLNPFDKLIGSYKAASVGANLRVVIQQPTAILRALDMIGANHLAAGAVRPLKGWAKAKKYAPIAQWKDWGYFDINTGRQMKDVLFDNASLLEKAKQVGMWGASMADSLAWGQLWNAVEAETKSKHEELSVGSSAYYETVAKRFTEIVDHTQVVDGILQRSQIMRESGALTKMATSFMGEPTKQYNMAVSAAYDTKNSTGDVRKKAVARLGRTAAALAVSGIINACAQSFIDAIRDDDKEKDYWEKWLAAFVGYGEDDKFINSNLASTFNPLSYVPFAKDILSIMQGYDVKRMDTEAISKTFNAVTNMYKSVTGQGKYTVVEASAQLFSEIARMYGLPVANVKRDIKSLVMSLATETDSHLMQYRMEKAMLNINYAGNSKNFMDILFNAYNQDSEDYEFIYNDLIKSGYDAEKIQSGMETRMKKAEGVEKASELSKRYMSPDDEQKYDNSLTKIKSSKPWKSANATQRKAAEAELYEFLTSDSDNIAKVRKEAKSFGVDETEYTLWQLAIEMADQPKGQKGSGSYDYTEKAEAINALTLGDREIAYFFGQGLNESSKEELYDALDAGIDLKEYVNFKAATSEMKADKNASGNSIPNSKKRKVVNYLNKADLTDEEWAYFYYEVMNYKK